MRRDLLPTSALTSRYRDACAASDALFDVIQEEALYLRPIRERHRNIFYLGHLEAFDWNLLRAEAFNLPAFDARYDALFAFGIDPVDGGLPTDAAEDWPALPQVLTYRERIRGEILAQLERSEQAAGDSQNTPRQGSSTPRFGLSTLLNVVIEHRLMHVETLAYMLHQMPAEQKRAGAPSQGSATRCLRREGVPVPAGTATLGLPSGPAAPFGWDNEFGSQNMQVPAFEIDRHMVSNGEFLEFIEAGGYEREEWWHPADWAWIQQAGIRHPAFWHQTSHGWRQRTMFDTLPLPLDWPVYVSHAEACAYARHVGRRLPTEAQWLRAAEGVAPDGEAPAAGNFDFRSWDPRPVDAPEDNTSIHGVRGLFGNGWEWTADAFGPLPGFEAFPFYAGYSANFFDGKHFVMKGGSARTAACMVRPSFRNWFQAHYQYVYAGFRCVSP